MHRYASRWRDFAAVAHGRLYTLRWSTVYITFIYRIETRSSQKPWSFPVFFFFYINSFFPPSYGAKQYCNIIIYTRQYCRVNRSVYCVPRACNDATTLSLTPSVALPCASFVRARVSQPVCFCSTELMNPHKKDRKRNQVTLRYDQ